MNHGISEIKPANIHAVMQAMMGEKALTRSEIAHRCHLSLTTVGKIIDGLLDYGILSQQYVRTTESGRTPALFSISSTVSFVLFHFSDFIWSMKQVDFALHVIDQVDWHPTPDVDPGEALRLFLLQCRETPQIAHHRIRLCALLTESSLFEPDLLKQMIRTHIGIEVSVTDNYASAMARAARYQDIVEKDRYTVGIMDTENFVGIVFCQDNMRQGTPEPIPDTLLSPFHHDQWLTQTLFLLHTVLTPDVLLICTTRSQKQLKEQVETTLASFAQHHPVTVLVKNADEILTLGVGLAVQQAWLTSIIAEEKEFRQHQQSGMPPQRALLSPEAPR